MYLANLARKTDIIFGGGMMKQVNILEAKTDLSKLIASLEDGSEEAIYLARRGKPIAKIVLLPKRDVSKRIGLLKGKYCMPTEEEWAAMDRETAEEYEETIDGWAKQARPL